MDTRSPNTGRRKGERDGSPETVPPKIVGRLLRQFLDEHYRKCLNQPIGMLDGKTLGKRAQQGMAASRWSRG